MALVGNLYPVPEGPYGKLPYIYLVYLAAGMLWLFVRGHRNAGEPSRQTIRLYLERRVAREIATRFQSQRT